MKARLGRPVDVVRLHHRHCSRPSPSPQTRPGPGCSDLGDAGPAFEKAAQNFYVWPWWVYPPGFRTGHPDLSRTIPPVYSGWPWAGQIGMFHAVHVVDSLALRKVPEMGFQGRFLADVSQPSLQDSVRTNDGPAVMPSVRTAWGHPPGSCGPDRRGEGSPGDQPPQPQVPHVDLAALDTPPAGPLSGPRQWVRGAGKGGRFYRFSPGSALSQKGWFPIHPGGFCSGGGLPMGGSSASTDDVRFDPGFLGLAFS